MLIKGTALVWCDDQEYELSEGGMVFLPRHPARLPDHLREGRPADDHTPAGIEGMFRMSGRDKSLPAPADFQMLLR